MRSRSQSSRETRGHTTEKLIERSQELELIERAFDGLTGADARGSVVIIEAPAGGGKSALLRAAAELGAQSAVSVLTAQGSELEVDFPFGIAMQLFEPVWLELPPSERERLTDGHVRWAASLLSGSRPALSTGSDTPGFDVVHGLYWFARRLCDTGGDPLAIVVDDAHLGDRPSLRFLAYLAERISELPIAVLIAFGPGLPPTDGDALRALSDNELATVLTPEPLTATGIADLVRTELPEAEHPFCEACAKVTRGNPFLLVELLQQLREDGMPPNRETAARLSELAPDSVLNAVVARMTALHPEASVVASAVSVLGSGTPLRRAADLTGLDLGVVSETADALASAHLLDPGEPLSFAQPVIAAAVRASMSPLELGEAHRRAAEVLRGEAAPDEWVAAHLMSAPPAADAAAVEALRAAAANALASGSTDTAIRLLHRALAEPPALDARPLLEEELARAEALAGSVPATERLGEAVDAAEHPGRRAELTLAHGRALYAQGRYRESAAVLDAALGDGDLPWNELLGELAACYVGVASLVPELRPNAASRHRRHLQGTYLLNDVHLALQESVLGTPRARVRTLVDHAWAQGDLLALELADGGAWQLASSALLFADELERALELCDQARAAGTSEPEARTREASAASAWPLYEQGRIEEATAAAQTGIDERAARWHPHFGTPEGALACCLLHRNELDQADETLIIMDEPGVQASLRFPFLLDVRAQLRLAQHDPERAHADAIEAGQRLERAFAGASPGVIAWRSTAAFALIAMSEPDHAAELARAELELAEPLGLTRVVMRDLRALGLLAGGREGLDLLAHAVELGRNSPPRLEYIYALIEHGAALRRANLRAAARKPLREALELCHRNGALALADRAREELASTGSRPRTEMLTGLGALTPSERRVADLAADGLTTRQVAETLFVSRKTVEFHLRHIYRKLGINSRPKLAEALREAA